MNFIFKAQGNGGKSHNAGGIRLRRTEHAVVFWLGLLAAFWLVLGAVTKPRGQGWEEWTSELAVGLASGVIAALLTFLLIDLMLARQRDAENREAHERERLESLLARLRAGGLEENRGVLEELRSAGWLKNGSLREADFSGANLEGMDFGSASLQRAIFEGASLRRASLTNADVSGARFARADLRGTRFDGAITTGADFKMANMDNETVLN